MSPLVRSLLALACAALLHASSANEMVDRVRAVLPNWTPKWPCAMLDMGNNDDILLYTQKIILPVQLVPRYTPINVTNAAKPDQALVNQHMYVCDKAGKARHVHLHPVKPNKHSPIIYNCQPPGACNRGVFVFTDQYVINKLL